MKIAERRLEAKKQLEKQLASGIKPWKGHQTQEWHKENKHRFTIVKDKKHVPLTPQDIVKIKRQIANLTIKLLAK